MTVPIVLIVLALCFTRTNSANELDIMAELFGESSRQDERFFGRQGKILFEQASTLNSMAFAKIGNKAESRLLAKKITLQVKRKDFVKRLYFYQICDNLFNSIIQIIRYSIYLSIHPSINPSIHPSIHSSIHPN